MKNKIEVIDFPVFCSYLVHVEIARDIGKALKQYKKTENVPWGDDGHDTAVTISVKNEPLSFIFLQPTNSPGTIAHEALHAMDRMMDYVDVEYDSETRAYHLGYIVNKIHKLMRRK